MDEDTSNPKASAYNGKVHNVNPDIEMPEVRTKAARFAPMGSPDPFKLTAYDPRSSPDVRTGHTSTRKDPSEQYVDLRGNPVDKAKTGRWRAAPFIYGTY